MFKAHLLAVDDDIRIRTLLADYLSRNGYAVHIAEHTKHADALMQVFTFDLLIVDIMMPGEDGIAFTERMHRVLTTPPPVILLTARGEPESRLHGLEAGAADYIPKPFEPKELLLRTQRLLPKQPASASLHFGTFVWKNENLFKEHIPVSLSERERELVKHLAERAGKEVSRDDLAEACGINERSIDVAITRLRKKLETDPKQPQFLQTIRGKGYILYGTPH